MAPFLIKFFIIFGSFVYLLSSFLALGYSLADDSWNKDHWFLSYYWFKKYCIFNIIGRILALIICSVLLFPYYLIRGIIWLTTTDKFERK